MAQGNEGSDIMWIKRGTGLRPGRKAVHLASGGQHRPRPPQGVGSDPHSSRRWRRNETSFDGKGSTKSEAKEDACSQARLELEQHKSLAGGRIIGRDRPHEFLGDKAADFLIALRGISSGLSVDQMDDLRQRLVSNRSLRQLGGPVGNAEESETRLGLCIANNAYMFQTISDLLEEAMSQANPALLARLNDSIPAV